MSDTPDAKDSMRPTALNGTPASQRPSPAEAEAKAKTLSQIALEILGGE